MNQFVHLHLHTEYSLLDGAARINRLFSAAKELKMPAVAITDHGNMYGVRQFAEAAKKAGIKPIFGSEFYVVADRHKREGGPSDFRHLILLAKNDIGYKNLMKLSSESFVNGFYYKPRIDMQLIKQHSEGLICLSACINGEVARLALHGDINGAKEKAAEYKSVFKSDYYIEVQPPVMSDQARVNPILVQIAKELDIPLVATNDVHYIRQNEAEMQDILMCISMQKRVDDPSRLKIETDQLYLKSYDEMHKYFADIPEALANTVKIADMCNVDILKKSDLYPKFTPEGGITTGEYLRSLTYEGLEKRYTTITEEIKARADFELGVIDRMGYNDYYLVVSDFIAFAERNNIPVGPGRGSGVGSIVAYAVGITKIDPLKYDLLFERFLNPDRVSPPDFDIDFCVDRRGEVIDYVAQKYGQDRVAQIITFGTLAPKAAVKDVARVMNVPYAEVDKLTKLMPFGKAKLKDLFGLTAEETTDKKDDEEEFTPIADLVDIYNSDATLRKVVDYASRLEGSPRHSGTHAAGVVISREDISDYVPLNRNGEDITTQFTMGEVEAVGLLKMDFLGLRTLTDIHMACELIEKNHGKKIDFYAMEYTDKNVFALIGAGNTDAVFQLESGGMKRFMRGLQPESIEDIIAGVALYRPGPMQFLDEYIANKHNPSRIKYLTPKLKPILDVTYGIMVYQEQVMQVFRSLGGASLAQADILRRAIGKKKAEIIAEQRQYFIHGQTDKNGNTLIPGCVNMGVPEKTAAALFDQIEKFANYGFNKSHAAAYAYLAYQTAYLKRYYFVEYMAAVLNNRITNIDEITKIATHIASEGVTILPPDINRSSVKFTVEHGAIRFGLSALKGVGEGAVTNILEERKKGGDFTSLSDVFRRIDSKHLNKRMIEAMIYAGAFDGFGAYRSQLMDIYEELFDAISKDKKQKESGQFSLFDSLSEAAIDVPFRDMQEYNKKYMLTHEKEVLGIFVSGHPLDEFRNRLSGYSFNTSMLETTTTAPDEQEEGTSAPAKKEELRVTMGGMITKIRRTLTRQNKSMAILRAEDLYGGIEVVLFPRQYEKFKDILEEDVFTEISGTLINDDEQKIICDHLKVLASAADTSIDTFIPMDNEPKKQKQLHLNIATDEQFNAVQDILNDYAGDAQVFVKFHGKRYQLDYLVHYGAVLHNELLTVLDEENIFYNEK